MARPPAARVGGQRRATGSLNGSAMLRRIRREEVPELARVAGFAIDEAEVDEFVALTDRMSELMDPFVDEPFPEPSNAEARRGEVRRATPADDPLGAIVHWCSVRADTEGPMSGKRVALKDNMAVAGVPMTCGSRLLADHLPAEDCVVARRVLAAGGEIVAKCNLDGFAWSAGAETSDFGPIRNPFDPTRSASGSSGGSAAALFYDGIDLSFGTDQAGSIRLPASWCGVLGLKPTHGLVPYTGIVPIDPSYDHVGPLARTAHGLAVGLQVVAGPDPGDPRQCGVRAGDYVGAVERAPDDLSGLVVGAVVDAFQHDGPDAPAGTRETTEATWAAVDRLTALGAEVRRVDVAEHRWGAGLMFAACAEGQATTLLGGGNGYGWTGRYATDLPVTLGRALAERPADLPPSLKMVLLLGTHFRRSYFGSLYAKAQNLVPALRRAYDEVLEGVDVLVMPTATHYAYEHRPDATLAERVLRGDSMLRNTAVFDATGHPALSMPAAEADGLPVGVMLVGRHFDDERLLSIARTWEACEGWRPAREPAIER